MQQFVISRVYHDYRASIVSPLQLDHNRFRGTLPIECPILSRLVMVTRGRGNSSKSIGARRLTPAIFGTGL